MAPIYNNSISSRGTKRQLPLISDCSMEELGLTPKNKKVKTEKPAFQIYEDETATPPSIIDTTTEPPVEEIDDLEFDGIMHRVNQFVNDYVKMATFTYSRTVVRWAEPLAVTIDKHNSTKPNDQPSFQSRLEHWRSETQWNYHQKRGRKGGLKEWDNDSDWFELEDAEKLAGILEEMFVTHDEILDREEKENVKPEDRMDPVIPTGTDPGKNISKIGGYWIGCGGGLAFPATDENWTGKGKEYWDKFGEVWGHIVKSHVDEDLHDIGRRQIESKDGGWGIPRWVERVCKAMKVDEGMEWNWKNALVPRWRVWEDRPWLQASWEEWDASKANVEASWIDWDSPER